MKILAIGDFHGRFPIKLKKIARKADLIISPGDYPWWSLKKIFFEHCYRTDREIWEVTGKKKYKEKILGDWKDAEKILKNLNSLNVPIITTVGNYDNSTLHDAFDVKKKANSWDWAERDFFSDILKKFSKIKRVDYMSIKIGGLVFIGALGHSFPGKVKSRSYKRHRKKLEKLFKKHSKENKEGRVIFLVHNMPYGCKLDKIRDKNAPTIVQGKHYGSKLIRRIIDKFQPAVCVGGHFHENQGKDKIGRTLVINGGAAYDGNCVLIDFDENRGKIKSVKFVN